MKPKYSPKNNPRVIIIQKLYGVLFNNDDKIDFPKHRFKKFIKDIVLGTIERNEIIVDELDKTIEKKSNINNNVIRLVKKFSKAIKEARN